MHFDKKVTTVSIIIPVYNGEKYLNEAIDSALNQTYKDIEVIVVDDGSTDNTPSSCFKPLAQPNSHLIWITKKNGGTASALNAGIKVATGDYIKWLSADDVLLPDAVENMLWHAISEKDPHNHIFYTNYTIIDQHGKHKMNWVEPTPPPDLWKKFYGNGSSSLIHKSVFEKCGLFDESLRFGEDYEFWLRATQLYGVHLTLIPVITVKYRNHPGQLTHKVGGGNDKKIKDSIMSRMSKK